MNFNDRRKQILAAIDYARISTDQKWPEEILAYQNVSIRKDIERNAGGFAYKIYTFSAKTKEENAPLFICIHGGGWLKGHMENDFSFASLLAHKINGVVFDLDYTTTAKAGFETMLAQAMDCSEYALEACQEYGCSKQRISIGGFSSGAHLTLATVLQYAMDDKMPFALQIPCYAPVDLRDSETSSIEQKKLGGDLTVIKELVFAGHPEYQYKPAYSPIIASSQLLSKCPETLMISAANCPFCHQDEAYAGRLAKAGVFVTSKCFHNSGHGFIPHFRDEWKDAVELMAAYIKAAKKENS